MGFWSCLLTFWARLFWLYFLSGQRFVGMGKELKDISESEKVKKSKKKKDFFFLEKFMKEN